MNGIEQARAKIAAKGAVVVATLAHEGGDEARVIWANAGAFGFVSVVEGRADLYEEHDDSHVWASLVEVLGYLASDFGECFA